MRAAALVKGEFRRRRRRARVDRNFFDASLDKVRYAALTGGNYDFVRALGVWGRALELWKVGESDYVCTQEATGTDGRAFCCLFEKGRMSRKLNSFCATSAFGEFSSSNDRRVELRGSYYRDCDSVCVPALKKKRNAIQIFCRNFYFYGTETALKFVQIDMRDNLKLDLEDRQTSYRNVLFQSTLINDITY